ncbi:MAG: choice-of-anchor G family protein [Jatrophihabitantaceae bacterium]
MHQPCQPTSRRTGRAIAGAVALSVGAGSTLLFAGVAPASAASPRAQAVGRFLDGAAGGSPIQAIVDLHDARATNPGTVSDQNPLDITVGGQGDIPLSHKLQLPGSGDAFHVGAANQVAAARSSGYSLGASGAVANSGGASLGGQGAGYGNATLDLSQSALPSSPIPLPGGNQPSIGSLVASIGAVSARAHTPAGVGSAADTHYGIGSLALTLSSPALAGVLAQVGNALTPPAGLPVSTPACSFKTQLLSTASVGGGALTIDPSSGAVTIDVPAALNALGVNINLLPANTDLLAYVTKYLSSANGLSAGVQQTIGGTLTTQKENFLACSTALDRTGQLPTFARQLATGQQTLADAIKNVVDKLKAGAGPSPLAPITDGLKQALQIGVNVQPNGPRGSYTSALRATPDQATGVVAGQTIVRAIEIDLGGGKGVSLALANAAAGPSGGSGVEPTHAPAGPVRHNAIVPTGIPAGLGPIGGGTPDLPLVLLAGGLLLAGAGALAWRVHTRRH